MSAMSLMNFIKLLKKVVWPRQDQPVWLPVYEIDKKMNMQIDIHTNRQTCKQKDRGKKTETGMLDYS